MTSDHPRIAEITSTMRTLRKKVSLIRESVETYSGGWSFLRVNYGIRIALFSLIDVLACIHSGERPYFGAHWYLSSYWAGYQIVDVTPEGTVFWNQGEWQRFARERNPRLEDFAQLSPNDFPVCDIIRAMECGRQWKAQITDDTGRLRAPQSRKPPERIEEELEELMEIVWEDFARGNADTILAGCRGLECLIGMVERYTTRAERLP